MCMGSRSPTSSSTRMKTVLVTGGTTRLGKVIADYLATSGWHVVRSSHRPDSGADIIMDLAHMNAGADLMMEFYAKYDRSPDAVVNNAALFTGSRAALWDVNYYAPHRIMDLMNRHRDVDVVNILDSRVLAKHVPSDEYSKTKVALRDLTRSLAWMSCGSVRVNAVAPGPVLLPTEVHEKAGETPFGRPTPQAVAEAVAFLLSQKYTTGCIIPVDGGQCATSWTPDITSPQEVGFEDVDTTSFGRACHD